MLDKKINKIYKYKNTHVYKSIKRFSHESENYEDN